MPDLGAHRRALGVDRLGESAQPRYRFPAHPDLFPAGAPAGGDRAIGDGGHGDPARGGLAVIFDQIVGHQRIGCPGLEGRRFDDAIAQRQRAELGGAEHVRRGGHKGERNGDRKRRTRVCRPGGAGSA